MDNHWDFGTYQCTFEPPHILLVRQKGEADEKAMRQLVALTNELYPKYGKISMLIDHTQSTGMTPGARKASADSQQNQANIMGPMALFGGNFAMRTMSNMMMRALTLMGKWNAPYAHLATEAEARAWLAEQLKKQP